SVPSLLYQRERLAKAGMITGLEPLEDDHLRCHQLGPVALRPLKSSFAILRPPRSHGIADKPNLQAFVEHAQHGLKHADVGLAARNHDVWPSDREEAGPLAFARRVEVAF